MSSLVEKTTSTGVVTEFPAEERARSVSQKTQCSSMLALPSGYAANEVEKRMLVFLVAWPPVGGFAESRPASRRVVAVRRTTGTHPRVLTVVNRGLVPFLPFRRPLFV